MCFNASLVQTAEIMAVQFNAYIDDTLVEPVYFASAFSLPAWPVLRDKTPDRFAPLRWGLIPSWVKDSAGATDIRYKTLNARIESVHEKSSFRYSSDNRRCAVPIDGWFEWREVKGSKYPYFIHREDGKPFLLAGLWDSWKDPSTGEVLETFSVITTTALGICARIHNTKERMPLILSVNQKDRWIDRKFKFADLSEDLVPQWKELTAYPAGPLVSSSKENRNVPAVRNRGTGPTEQMEFF